MFYSQFILAKKGPLGTIWIAAHLERKLKKNQVADTDIGDSVDSILFPEVPIALRLSSHLLLGVVRIYSRKVNYLFHDCSEALLKVKQAFRSTAVDLPPEESTAPYHSITLPETFDLDDFVLPDSALLSGNFDDRHVSTREQITLQDTLEGPGYSTSQFGLDERFGDGDASQIGVDLDEELLLNNNLTLQDASVLGGNVHQGESASDFTKMDIGEEQHRRDEERNDEASKELSELLGNTREIYEVSNAECVNRNDDSSRRLTFNIQTPDLNEVFLPYDHTGGPSATHDFDYCADPTSPEFNETANFPSTPGLLEEVSHAISQKLPASSPLDQEVEHPDATNDLIDVESTGPKSGNLAQVVSSPTSVLAETKPDSALPGNDDGQNHDLANTAPIVSSSTSVLTESAPFTVSQCLGETSGPDTANNILLPEGSNDVDGLTLENATKLSNLDHGREDAHSCYAKDISALSSDFLLRSCTSESNQPNLTSSVDIFQQRAEGFSFGDQLGNLGTPVMDPETHFTGSLLDQQGLHSTIDTATNLGVDQSSNKSALANPLEMSSNFVPKDAQSSHLNCMSSSEFSEPERLRFALSGNVNLTTDLEKQITEKGVAESDGSVDRISNLSGHKRQLIESTPDLQNDISTKISGISRKKRNHDYIPNDDDLLASILVGRRTPALRLGPTPSLQKPPGLKRPRLTSKVGLLKRRKVLLDDTMVLHADAIRQQLINTEDIRRVRKKVPCTRPEIWRIQISSQEEDIFCESIFTGLSDVLNSLITRRYESVHSIDTIEPSVVEPNTVGEVQGSSGLLELVEAERGKISVAVDTQEPLVSPIDPHHVNQQNNTISRGELEADTCADPEMNYATEGGLIDNNVVAPNDDTLQVQEVSNAEAASITVQDMRVDTTFNCPQDGPVNIGIEENGEGLIPSRDRFMVDVGADFPADSSLLIGCANSLVADLGLVDGRPITCDDRAMKEAEEGKAIAEYETVVDGELPGSEVLCNGRPQMDSVPIPASAESERVPSAVGENSCINMEGGLDVESTPMELAATRESSDFCSAIDDIDTDFLNADDDVEYDDETNNDVRNTEEAQSLENMGWSSRTRGVARYLKNVFDQETGRGRKSIAVDHLLAGKTRKEASRMFFETLVLKTRDYIHVEQEKPCDLINIKPRGKLLKSEF